MSNNDLQALFANIRPRSRDPSAADSNVAAQAPSSVQPHTVGTAVNQIASRTPVSTANVEYTPNDSTTASNAKTNASTNAATAQSLLNLLNFGAAQAAASPAPSATATKPPVQPTSQKVGSARAVSASDLVARFMSPPTVPTPPPADGEDHGGGSGLDDSINNPNPAENALLKLLGKSKSSHSSRAASAELTHAQPASNKEESTQPLMTELKTEQPKSIFTYQNPFEALNASRGATPSSSTPAPKALNSPLAGVFSPDVSARKKLTPRSATAKADRLVRETPSRSNGGTPEPFVSQEEAPKPGGELPMRTVKPSSSANADPFQDPPEDAQEPFVPVANGDSPPGAADEWEDAEESPTSPNEPRKIPVYNFPIKPFISLTLQSMAPSDVQIRDDGVMEISRLKKDFDQLDRSLAAATTKYIAYALTKNGGMRIIRQDDGSDRQVFRNSHDRVFNVSFCTTAISTPPSDHHAILGTGVSGTVYYATVSKEGNDLFEKNELDSECLTFPPWPPADENSAGGVLKTRAKRSSSHPEYFAIGRGKSIHIIWPATTMFSKYGITETSREVDMEKLYQERNLQVATGKAGKDFAFSEDDTMIVSLDKTGRLRFWDIRELIDETNATAGKVTPIKIDTPLLSLSTASPAEKSWPTSVLFLDKARPYMKGGALRYVLVGLRQNHTLQLWDIALGKAVQELNFPHENETDGVCSVNYHPGSGVIVVGHPTRNSLFFIHLSAPRYTMSPNVDQAAYVQDVAAKDPSVPKPDSTACMSGVREISFASRGQLRSVELLPIHKSPNTPKGAEKAATDPLFELYAVHSKGVTCLTITKEDLGWDASSKVIYGLDAVKEEVITLKELKLGSVIEETNRSISPPEELAPIAPKSSKKKTKKVQQAAETTEIPTSGPALPEPDQKVTLDANGPVTQPEPAALDAPPPKEGKGKKKKTVAQATDSATHKTTSRTASPAKLDPPKEAASANIDSKSQAQAQAQSATSKDPDTQQYSIGISGDWLDKEMNKLEHAVAAEFKKELGALYTNIQNDRLVQDSTSSARQEAVLRLVSSTLTNNVEKSIANIVGSQIQQVVVPAISNVTAQVIQAQVGDVVAKTLHHIIPHEVGKHVPMALNSVLAGPQVGRAIQDAVSHKMVKQMEAQIVELISRSVTGPITAAAGKAADEVEARMSAQIRHLEQERRRDTARMEKLSTVISGMAETLKSMSDTQVAFQEQILRDRQQLALLSEPSTALQVSTARKTPSPAPIARPTPQKPKTQQEIELEEISTLMSAGRYEEGSIRWLHSSNQVELFDNLFIRFTPEYLSTDVSPLVAFSIAVTVAKDMNTNEERRIEWINTAMDAIDWNDPEIAELSQHAPQLLDTLISKVEGLYMKLAEEDSANPVLRLIPPVARKARDMRSALSATSGRLTIN